MKNKSTLIKLYEEELNKTLHYQIYTEMNFYGSVNETKLREDNGLKLKQFKQLLNRS